MDYTWIKISAFSSRDKPGKFILTMVVADVTEANGGQYWCHTSNNLGENVNSTSSVNDKNSLLQTANERRDHNVNIGVAVFCLVSREGKYYLIINVIGIIFCHFSNPREYLPDPVQEKDRTPSNPETQLAQSSESFPTKTNSSCDSITNSNII